MKNKLGQFLKGCLPWNKGKKGSEVAWNKGIKTGSFAERTEEWKRKIGEANNLNSFNFSGNLGFDIDYKITQDWFLNVTPMLKYQFNTFSNSSGNFQPYYFGVYSGVNYRF